MCIGMKPSHDNHNFMLHECMKIFLDDDLLSRRQEQFVT